MHVFRYLLVLWFSLAALSAEAAETVGTVDRARGEASVLRQDQEHALAQGQPVQFLDVLRTQDSTRLEARFIDQSVLVLGDNSELTIDEMVYEPDTKGRAVLRLAKGVFRMTSGQVNKVSGGTLTVHTPLATIGVRGTDFWGQQSEDTLLMAVLDDGELFIQTETQAYKLNTPLSAIKIQKDQPVDVFTLSPEQLDAATKTVAW